MHRLVGQPEIAAARLDLRGTVGAEPDAVGAACGALPFPARTDGHDDREEVKSWITPDVHVSMNMWAAYPEFLDKLESGFAEFLKDESGDPLKKEYLIPIIVDGLLKQNKATVKVLETQDKWIGITYKEDTELAQAGFREMIRSGKYPAKLWD